GHGDAFVAGRHRGHSDDQDDEVVHRPLFAWAEGCERLARLAAARRQPRRRRAGARADVFLRSAVRRGKRLCAPPRARRRARDASALFRRAARFRRPGQDHPRRQHRARHDVGRAQEGAVAAAADRISQGKTMSKISLALSRRRFIRSASALAAGLAAPAVLRGRAAHAVYPERPVKVVVANTPGGPSDIVGRIVTAALQQSTGKTFIIENRGGAGGNIGMGFAAHAEPDGYTLLLATNAYSVNYALYHQLPFDPSKDFVAISELATSPNTF